MNGWKDICKTVLLTTTQGDRHTVKTYSPIKETIWALDICATPEMLVERKFIEWLKECTSELHADGKIDITIRK